MLILSKLIHKFNAVDTKIQKKIGVARDKIILKDMEKEWKGIAKINFERED